MISRLFAVLAAMVFFTGGVQAAPEEAPPAPTAPPKTAATTPELKAPGGLDAPVAGDWKDVFRQNPESRWSLGAGYAPILGMKAEFTVTDGVATRPNLAGQNREYLDGYVRVDSSGNAGGETTFWGYGSSSQEVGGNIEFRSIASSRRGNQVGRVTDDSVAAGAGFELYGLYDLGPVPFLRLKDASPTWGLRLGLQYAHVDLHNQSSTQATVQTFTDAFSLGGSPAPGAGFAGSFLGPNTLLPDTALVRTFGGTAQVKFEGRRDLEVHLAVSQWGSYVQIPMGKRLRVMLEGGFLLAVASGTYEYHHRARLNNSGGQTLRGREQRTSLLPGFYAGLGFGYDITPRLSLMASGRYQFLRRYEVPGVDSTATLDSRGAFVLGLSTVWRF